MGEVVGWFSVSYLSRHVLRRPAHIAGWFQRLTDWIQLWYRIQHRTVLTIFLLDIRHSSDNSVSKHRLFSSTNLQVTCTLVSTYIDGTHFHTYTHIHVGGALYAHLLSLYASLSDYADRYYVWTFHLQNTGSVPLRNSFQRDVEILFHSDTRIVPWTHIKLDVGN